MPGHRASSTAHGNAYTPIRGLRRQWLRPARRRALSSVPPGMAHAHRRHGSAGLSACQSSPINAPDDRTSSRIEDVARVHDHARAQHAYSSSAIPPKVPGRAPDPTLRWPDHRLCRVQNRLRTALVSPVTARRLFCLAVVVMFAAALGASSATLCLHRIPGFNSMRTGRAFLPGQSSAA